LIDQVFPDSEECPDCGCGIFRPGPRGGLSQNVECAQCGARFNVTRLDPVMMEGRQGHRPIVWARRIPSEKDGGAAWREDMFPKVCQ
jgi:hypothetical protein